MKDKIERILIIGAGNVATHIAKSLSINKSIVGIISKNKVSARELALKINCPFINDLSSLPDCDLVLICTNDSSLADIESEIPLNFNIAYTSGSVELNKNSSRNNYGVFYPLQTFSKERNIDLENVPFLIEATNKKFGQRLFELASEISNQVSFNSSIERKKLHIAAVFVNNFSNHLALLAKEYIDENNLNWNYLKPLIQETTNKIISNSPENSQTGPARRNDQFIIEEHLSMLKSYPKEIYKVLSESILNTYYNKD